MKPWLAWGRGHMGAAVANGGLGRGLGMCRLPPSRRRASAHAQRPRSGAPPLLACPARPAARSRSRGCGDGGVGGGCRRRRGRAASAGDPGRAGAGSGARPAMPARAGPLRAREQRQWRPGEELRPPGSGACAERRRPSTPLSLPPQASPALGGLVSVSSARLGSIKTR